MLELSYDVIVLAILMYVVYVLPSKESPAPQVNQRVTDLWQELEADGVTLDYYLRDDEDDEPTSEWAKVYDAFWYGEPDDGELYFSKPPLEKTLDYHQVCEQCGADYSATCDLLCDDCYQEIEQAHQWYETTEGGEPVATGYDVEYETIDDVPDSELLEWYGLPVQHPFFNWCECCGHVKVDHNVDTWCSECNTEAEYFEAIEAYREGDSEQFEVEWGYALPTVDVPVYEPGSLEPLTIRELKSKASIMQVKRYGNMTKPQLKEALYALKF